MREELGALENQRVVRELDPRASRNLWSLLLLVMALAAGCVLYAWPHVQLRQTGVATERMNRARERLLEENRKLRLEKASLENLRRIEAIATRQLGMAPPPPERTLVVEKPAPLPEQAQLASGETRERRRP